MSDISELERRISVAMDRIGAGLAELSVPKDDGDLNRLQEALAAERTVNAQLEERVKAVHEKQDTLLRNLEAEAEALRQDAARQTAETEKLRNQNQTQMAELETLKSRRDADRAELDAIIGELEPILGGAANA